MANSKRTDSVRLIEEKSTAVLSSIEKVKADREMFLSSLRLREAALRKKEEDERQKELLRERQAQASRQLKAWTMPDDEEERAGGDDSIAPAPEAPSAEAAAPAVKDQPSEPVPAKEEVKPAEIRQQPEAVKEPAARPVEAEKPSAAPVTETAQSAAPSKAAPAEAEKPAEDKTEKPAAQAEKPAVPEKPAAQDKPAVQDKPAAAAPQPQPAAPVRPPVQPAAVPARPAVQPAAAANRPQGQPGAYPNRPQGQPGAYPNRPQGPGTYPNRPQSAYPNRPQGQGTYPNRPQGSGTYPNRPQGAYPNRPQGQGTYPNRPQGPGTFGNRPQGQGGYGNRPQGQGSFGSRPGPARPPKDELIPAEQKQRASNYDPNKNKYVRQHDPERVAKNRKQLVKDNFVDYDDDYVRTRKNKNKKPSAQQLMAPIKIETAYMTAETITVKDLTERIGKPAPEILKKLLMLGIVSNINSELDFDTASLVCTEFGVTLEKKLDKTAEEALSDTRIEDKEEDLQPRPPVITIMGHVDHGKTSLLDYIRSSHVTASEAGGITQHIGAYTVELNGRTITFLDTPGHEAFTAMRMRGAQATDIAILVVAADDGVMPQTIEAINHAKAAGVPLIVAINKMDKPGANPERIKEELTKYDLVPEEWGGETIVAEVSAVTGQGVDELLELILLQADMLQLRANPDRMASGVIIEAKLDKARGPIATVLIKNGTLKVGDNIIAGLASGRVRALTNDKGERVKSAGPGMPVEIAGFNDVPSAGDEMDAVEDDRLMRQVAEERRNKIKAARSATNKVSLENLFEGINEGKAQTLNLIIKADVQGSVEAVKQALEKLSNDSVKINVLHSAVGAVTQDDVNLAAAFGATIIGFNIRPDSQAKDAAEKLDVEIRLYRIIYQAIEDIEKAMNGMLQPEFKEVILGHAQVRNVFKITGVGMIAGCYVQDGKLQRNAQVRLLRDNVVVYEGKLSSLRRFKDDVREAAQGFECGVGLENYSDIKENDVIECFVMEEITQE
ncbi:MAG: translation initiation factor IF-2 [Clostridia bacterium]|nr:translation initiation factor IF-2 [Clostridia bacterium]